MRNFLQGNWLGHPLHPVLVHLPIGLFVLSFIFDLFSFIAGSEVMVRGAFFLILFGVFGAAVASIPGVADFKDLRRDSKAKRLARLHVILNIVALALYVVSFFQRAAYPEVERTPFAAFLVALVALGVLSISGYIGGKLVYEQGVGVGRHRREAPLPDETVVKNNASDWEYVAVGDLNALQPGHTFRAEINGTIVAVANIKGKFFAFQDFCTHRYASLSEGTFEGTEVRCPWHNSCFDVRDGKVTKGPAKVDLKVFPVRIRDGKVEVQAGGPKGEAPEGTAEEE